MNNLHPIMAAAIAPLAPTESEAARKYQYVVNAAHNAAAVYKKVGAWDRGYYLGMLMGVYFACDNDDSEAFDVAIKELQALGDLHRGKGLES